MTIAPEPPSGCDLDGVRGRLRAVRIVGALRDALIIAVGLLTLHATPPSLARLDSATSVSTIWSGALIIGGLVSLAGALAERPRLEVVGSFTSAGGFGVWAFAALRQPDLTPVSIAVGLVFVAGTVGQIQKGLLAMTFWPTKERGRDA